MRRGRPLRDFAPADDDGIYLHLSSCTVSSRLDLTIYGRREVYSTLQSLLITRESGHGESLGDVMTLRPLDPVTTHFLHPSSNISSFLLLTWLFEPAKHFIATVGI